MFDDNQEEEEEEVKQVTDLNNPSQTQQAAMSIGEDNDEYIFQELLEGVDLTKDDLESINEWNFQRHEHLPKIKMLIEQNPDDLIFTENTSDISSELEACIIVYDNNRKHFILARIKPKNLPDAASSTTTQEELRQAMIDCFGDTGFNSTQQRRSINETIKLTWI